MNDLSREDPDEFGPSTVSVARCYVVKNRRQDVVPYDGSRVELPSTKDDYVNASHVRGLTDHAPRAIAAQAPLARTAADFWAMAAQEGVETVACLVSEADAAAEGVAYWPEERGGDPLAAGATEVTLQVRQTMRLQLEKLHQKYIP